MTAARVQLHHLSGHDHEHPFRMIFPVFRPPGILWNDAPKHTFDLIGMSAYTDGKPNPRGGRGVAEFQKFSPDIFCRFIAKIGHGAAVAELGLDAFTPFLPDVIL